MFVRMSGRGKYRYLQLVENRREGRRTVQRVLCTLGRMEELKANGAIAALVRSLGRFAPRKGSEEIGQGRPGKGGAAASRVEPVAGQVRPPAVIAAADPPERRSGPSQDRVGLPAPLGTPPSSKAREKAAALKACPIFSGLDEEHLAQLSRLAVARDLKTGQFLFFEGDSLESSYLIVSGIIKLVRHSPSGAGLITGIYGEGELLGNAYLFVGRPHLSSAQAIVDCKVLSISTGNLIAFLQQNPALSVPILGKMMSVLAQRRQAAVTRLGELAGERVERRLARVLWALCLALGSGIPLTRREIAEMAGTTAETAARFISRLTREGIVRSLRGKVVVVDQAQLRTLAEAPRDQV